MSGENELSGKEAAKEEAGKKGVRQMARKRRGARITVCRGQGR